MIARIAAAVVFLAMLILLRVTFVMDGSSAILFFFVGHPLLILGILLGVFALARRLARERAARGKGARAQTV